MIRAFCVVIVFITSLASCTQRMVCPAYQSAFIYDKDALRKKYSYFNTDSTPKVLTASRNKYLIGVPVSYKKKVKQLQTVAMKPVNPVVPDSLQADFTKEEMDVSGVERNVNDSTAVIRMDTLVAPVQDSVYVISKEKEIRILKYDTRKRSYFVDTVGYNTEQDNYMWYLRDVLVLPDARIAKMGTGKEDKKSTDSEKKEGGFFKNLFKKKKKQTEPLPDSTQSIKAEEIDYGYDDFDGKVKDSTQVEQQPLQQTTKPKKEKGSLFKKKKTDKKKQETPPAKKEEEGDGF